METDWVLCEVKEVKVKVSQRVPGGLGSQIS
jgi:hypothetical protein